MRMVFVLYSNKKKNRDSIMADIFRSFTTGLDASNLHSGPLGMIWVDLGSSPDLD